MPHVGAYFDAGCRTFKGLVKPAVHHPAGTDAAVGVRSAAFVHVTPKSVAQRVRSSDGDRHRVALFVLVVSAVPHSANFYFYHFHTIPPKTKKPHNSLESMWFDIASLGTNMPSPLVVGFVYLQDIKI
jgi:hypothetical protein